MGRDYKDIVRELWVRVPIMLDRAERNLEKQEENYWNIVGMMAGASFDEEIIRLKRDNESLKATIRDKEQVISIQKSKNFALTNSHEGNLDNLELLQRCSKYEKKLYELGVDPNKIK